MSMVDVELEVLKLMPVAIMAGPLLRAVAGAPAGGSSAPRTLQRSHCAVAQVWAYLVGMVAGCFLMLVVVVDVLFCDFVSGLLLALVAVARFFVGLGIGFTLSSGNKLIPN